MIPKFRGKSTDESNKNQWVYGNLIIDGNNALIVNGIVECGEDYVVLADWCPVDLKTVGQSTGLFDKNGVEIFEGDIIEWKYVEPLLLEQMGAYPVKWKNGAFRLGLNDNETLFDFIEDCEWYEVIDNIYENPDLLESVEE